MDGALWIEIANGLENTDGTIYGTTKGMDTSFIHDKNEKLFPSTREYFWMQARCAD